MANMAELVRQGGRAHTYVMERMADARLAPPKTCLPSESTYGAPVEYE